LNEQYSGFNIEKPVVDRAIEELIGSTEIGFPSI
jgi:hypothetical protein